MKFHLDVRAILRKAIQLALLRGAEGVGVEHLMECAPDLRSAQTIPERDIPFTAEVFAVLQESAQLADLERSSLVCTSHLKRALNKATGGEPSWSTSSTTKELRDNFLDMTVSPRPIGSALNFSACLGPGLERFSPESSATLSLAWLLRDSDELTGRDLLRALIAISNQLEDRNVHMLLYRLRPANRLVETLQNIGSLERMLPPVFSSECYRVISVALREAGAERPVSNLDLLIGLAECGQELLAAEDISAEEIRRCWAEGG
ncbi:MAG: hypothetical protein KF760_30235 [Candidatus Eremiobacteraeota bacterium]|nr:hypothetical protein [Candidatus Eremiobacteraeota bacterium]MCW5871701.1 hypothetical protein [Candidatus Eremiobacteraeota bacterium]